MAQARPIALSVSMRGDEIDRTFIDFMLNFVNLSFSLLNLISSYFSIQKALTIRIPAMASCIRIVIAPIVACPWVETLRIFLENLTKGYIARGKVIKAARASFQSLVITTIARTIIEKLSLKMVATEFAAVFCSIPTSLVILDINWPVELLLRYEIGRVFR